VSSRGGNFEDFFVAFIENWFILLSEKIEMMMTLFLSLHCVRAINNIFRAFSEKKMFEQGGILFTYAAYLPD
jgi:hypothetical protein